MHFEEASMRLIEIGLGLAITALALGIMSCAPENDNEGEEPPPTIDQTPSATARTDPAEAQLSQLKALFPTLQGRNIDPATGVEVLTLLPTDADATDVDERRARAEELLGRPVRIEKIPQPLRLQPEQSGQTP